MIGQHVIDPQQASHAAGYFLTAVRHQGRPNSGGTRNNKAKESYFPNKQYTSASGVGLTGRSNTAQRRRLFTPGLILLLHAIP